MHRTLLLTLLLLAPGLASAAPQVVATLKPLQLIAQAITEGVSEPRQLLSAGASPHDYQLRPSDLQTLQEADLVLWVGPAMEPFLQKPLTQLEQTRILTLLESTPGGDAHDRDGRDNDHKAHHDEHDDHHPDEEGKHTGADDHHSTQEEHADHDHEGMDPHLWLSPSQGILIARRLSDALSNLDSANAATYRANLAQLVAAVEAVDRELEARLAPLRERGYFVFHDGYSHFENHYRLNHLGAFTLSPQRSPGARQLNEIRQQLETSRVHCVFSEPQFTPRLIEAITEGLPVRQGSLDPLARDAASYPDFLRQLGDAFATCLETE